METITDPRLFFTLVLITAFCVALGFGAFIGWVLFERDNAPFKDIDNDQGDQS